MAIVPLPLLPASEARALLHHLLEHGDVVGRDTVGRTIIQLAVDDRTLETLVTFDAEADSEPEPDEESAAGARYGQGKIQPPSTTSVCPVT
jgi:hypothetical protein